jgi:PAXNEB protein
MPSAFRRKAKESDENGNHSTASSSSSSSLRPPPPPSSSSFSSSFATLRGVKPWQGGQYLTSTGLNDLDVIMGGGQPLGTCLVIRHDRFHHQGDAPPLVKYWCAEAISQQQQLIAPVVVVVNNETGNDNDDFGDANQNNGTAAAELQTILNSLPRNLHWDKWNSKSKRQEQTTDTVPPEKEEEEEAQLGPSSSIMMDIVEEEDEDEEEQEQEEEEDKDEGLEIAWQYKQSVQQQRLGTVPPSNNSSQTVSSTNLNKTVFCHSYDLSGRMTEQEECNGCSFDPSACITTIPMDKEYSSSSHRRRGMKLFRKLVQLLQEKIQSDHPNKAVLRLLLYHPPLPELSVALPLLQAYIRQPQSCLPVVMCICIPTTTTTTTTDLVSYHALCRTSDIVLATEGFAARREYPPPPEFRHLHGILTVTKNTTIKKLTEVTAWIYGLKRDRRKLHLPLLHIPPEDYADHHGGSVGAGGVRSGAGRVNNNINNNNNNNSNSSRNSGMGCASNLSGSSVLDF